MLKGYLNYPNKQVTAHQAASCSEVKKMKKVNQRSIRIDSNTISNEINQFAQRAYRFGSDETVNDMWLEIDFGDWDFELAVFDFIHRLLSKRYKPFRDAVRVQHC
jgi:hypothetical protein